MGKTKAKKKAKTRFALMVDRQKTGQYLLATVRPPKGDKRAEQDQVDRLYHLWECWCSENPVDAEKPVPDTVFLASLVNLHKWRVVSDTVVVLP